MSRARDARRKTKRQSASVAATPTRHARPLRWLRLAAPLVILVAIAAFAIIGALGTDASAEAQVDQEVATLLAGIPQEGATLGDPKAPITLQVFADLECPTVRRFVRLRLPRIINTWVRSGVIKLEYRSLETDTRNEHTFFTQEIAALAASSQDKMWNFVLTAVHEQQFKRVDRGNVIAVEHFNYVTEGFLTDIASRMPGLDMAQWRRDREDEDTLLFKRVANSVHLAHLKGMRATPAFLIGRSGGKTYRRIGPKTERSYLINAASLDKDVEEFADHSAAFVEHHGVSDAGHNELQAGNR